MVEILPAAEPGRYRFRTFGAALGLSSQELLSVAEDRHQSLWVGSKMGAAKILPGRFTIFGPAEGIPSAATLLEPRNGGVIAMEASRFWRFIRFDDRRFVVTELPLSIGTPSWGWNQIFLVPGLAAWVRTRSATQFSNICRVNLETPCG